MYSKGEYMSSKSSTINEQVQELIDEYINPGFEMYYDGIELIDIISKGDSWEVALKFNGGCFGGLSAEGATLKNIEFFLSENLCTPGLTVINANGQSYVRE
jgi:Fe-S cluster biogenesis protein NfuA